MKCFRLLVFVPFIFTLVACQSREEKATKLIKEQMFKTLYDFSSYEPIETKVDSAFTSIYTDSVILSNAYLINAYLTEAKQYIEKTKDAQSTLEIWGYSYSSYALSKYNKAKEEFNLNLESAKVLMDKIKDVQQLIKERAKDFKPTFCGWQAKHKFRCKTKAGNFDLPNYLYVFDPDFKKIIYEENTEDEENQEIREIIDEALIGDTLSNNH